MQKGTPDSLGATEPAPTQGGGAALQLLLFNPANGARVFQLPVSGEVTLGREATCELRLPDRNLSRRHLTLRIGDEVQVCDLGSLNGVRVTGRKIEPRTWITIAVGEPISVGDLMMVLQWIPSAAPQRPQVRAAMEQLQTVLAQVAASEINVLLLGETGVGKGIIAESLHRQSPRNQGPLLQINCASLSESLLESELFGHERGAFTNAVSAKPGLLETAQGGTVLLDEVGEMGPPVQARLLRAIETKMITRLGALKPRLLDVRFISATNRDLSAAMSDGTFRPDLFFRLDGITLAIPPLRERLQEIEPLARKFVAEASLRAGRTEPPDLSLELIAHLSAYPWPGNIRELRNAMERAVLFCGDGPITVEHLSTLPAGRATAGLITGASRSASPSGEADHERRQIVAALERCGGNQTQAAKQLGIARRTLVRRLTEYDLVRPRKRR